jgi:replication factor A1
MDENYQSIVGFISEKSGLPAAEIERKIEAKQAKLSGLISKTGAAQIIAAELNISFDKQVMKISQIAVGMRKINLHGKIITLFPIREYNKNGRSGRIGSFVLADETSNIRVVMWDENHIELIGKGDLFQECFVEISNATLRNGEIHLTSFSEIKPSSRVIAEVVTKKPLLTKSIGNFAVNDNVSTRGFIVQMFEPKFFYVCPACKKKVSESGDCVEHGKVAPEKRALLNFVLDDGTGNIRSIIFSEQLEKIMGKEELETPELFAMKKQDFLGKEIIVTGQVKRNNVYNNDEFVVASMEEINLDNLIGELER